MFKKLKDKIAEEVKQSPLKTVQQLAQAVVSPSSSSVFEPSSGNDKFCIEEGDIEEEEASAPVKSGGFTSVTLTGQTSSPLRDPKLSFRPSPSLHTVHEAENFFPVFEPQHTNFHVQSEVESASEVEDRYSQLEHINKESLYEAYRKVYNRYNRMKNKYHELVTHYRQLDREKERAKTVLTETQDKALLRISELREQCVLEQQAKAHLEEALRNELEERDHIISSLKTKVQYLKTANESGTTDGLVGKHLSPADDDNLIDFTDNSQVTKVPSPSVACSDLDWPEEQIKKCKEFFNERSSRINALKTQLEILKKSDINWSEIQKGIKNDNNLFLPQENPNQDSNIPESLDRLLNELTEEVKTVQDLTDAYIQHKPQYSSKVRSDPEETKDNRTGRILQESGVKTNNNNELDLEKLVSQYKEESKKYQSVLKELEKQNQDLTNQLQEYAGAKELIGQKFEDLNNTCTTLKSYLQTVNNNFSTETLTRDVVETWSSSRDELSQELFVCVQNLYCSKIELNSLKSQLEKLGKDHEDIKVKLKLLQSEKENNSKENTAENKTLGEQLERLKKENNLLSSQQESLKIELSDLRKEKKEVENKVKILADLVKQNEEDNKSNQETLKLVNVNFIEEKNTLQNKITTLQSDLSKKDQNNSALQQENNELNEKLLIFKQERETLLTDKNQLHSKIEQLKIDIDKTKQEHSKLLENSVEIANEVSSKQQEFLNREKENLVIKLNDVEQELEKNKGNLSIVSQAKDVLSEELEVLKGKLESTSAEKLKLQTKVDHLEKELELSKQEYLTSSEALKQVTHNLNVLSKQHQELATENNNAKKTIEKLVKDLEVEKSQNLSSSETNDGLLDNFKAMEKRKNELDDEINAKLKKIKQLEEEKEETNKLVTVEIQSKKELMAKSMLEKESLLSQIEFLKKDVSDSESNVLVACKRADEVDIQNSALVEKVKRLEEELQRRSGEFKSTMSEMMKTYEELSLEKCDLEKSIEELTSQSKIKVEEVMSLKSINEQLSQELKAMVDQEQEESSGFKLKYDMLLAEFQEIKQNHNLVLEAKHKVNDELTLLKQEYKNTLTVLDGMKNELQNQQQLCSELNQSLNDLSESFQLKSDEIENKRQENNQLKGELKNCSDKYDQTNNYLQKLTKEKHAILEKLHHTFSDIKLLKKVQQNLTELIGQFKKEMFENLNLIRIKTEKELFSQTKNILLEHEANSSHLVDLQMKTKEEINAFNSKLQSLEAELQKANESLNAKVCHNCEPGKDKFSGTSTHPYSDEHGTDSCQLQSNLSQAVKLLRFLKENYVSKSPHQQVNGIAHLCLNEDVDLEMKESWSSDKMFSEIDLFLNKCEKISLDTNINNLVGKFETDGYLNQNIPLEPSCDKLIISKVDASNKDLKLEVQQLLQALHLKNETINELQKTIGEYETGSNQVKNDQSSSLLSLLSDESITERTKEDVSKNEKWMILEQENQALMQKVLDLQETYDLKIQNLVADYENKLEEKTLFDLEVTSKEKKNTISQMKEQIQNLQEDLDDRGDAFEKLYEEHQKTVKEREEEVRQMRVNYEKEVREQDKKWRSCLDRRVAEEEIRHQVEVNELTGEWAKQRKELETASRLAVSVVESGSSSSEMLRRQVQALTVQLNALEANRCEMCETKRAFARERRKSNGSSRSIQDCTEMEYLRNILYEYMMGKEPLVLAKVLCALVKFDDTQTNDIVVKEQQKITLLGQLGLQ